MQSVPLFAKLTLVFQRRGKVLQKIIVQNKSAGPCRKARHKIHLFYKGTSGSALQQMKIISPAFRSKIFNIYNTNNLFLFTRK